MRMTWSSGSVLGGAGALLVAGVVVTLIAARQTDTPFPASSPQGTVATYFRLLQDGQVDRAYTLVSPDTGMTLQDFHQQYDTWSQSPHRVTLLHASVSGDNASVIVAISTFSAGPFGASDNTVRDTLTLTRTGARGGRPWRISSPAYL